MSFFWHLKYLMMYINCTLDLVACIGMNGWSEDFNVKDRCNRSHPGYERIRKATQGGYHLIAYCVGEAGKPRPCWWLSFSRAEGILLGQLCKNSSLVHKAAVKILKVVRKKNESELCLYEEQPWLDSDVLAFLRVPESSYLITWAFHSYVLKTMFLHEWFEHPEESYWNVDKLALRIHSILERIHKSLQGRDIRSFWLPDYKLFNFRARRRTRTKKCEQKLCSLITYFEKLQLINKWAIIHWLFLGHYGKFERARTFSVCELLAKKLESIWRTSSWHSATWTRSLQIEFHYFNVSILDIQIFYRHFTCVRFSHVTL